MSDSVRPHRRKPTRLPRPWDSPGKNTGVDCHFLLQCMKVKSQSEVTQSCLTLSDPMDCSLPGSSIPGIFQARVLEWGAIAFSIKSLSCVQLFGIPWTVAHQAPPSMGFFRQEYWSGLPCSPPEDLPNPRIELKSLLSPALAGRFFTTSSLPLGRDRQLNPCAGKIPGEGYGNPLQCSCLGNLMDRGAWWVQSMGS